jgi:hypothetical protein
MQIVTCRAAEHDRDLTEQAVNARQLVTFRTFPQKLPVLPERLYRVRKNLHIGQDVAQFVITRSQRQQSQRSRKSEAMPHGLGYFPSLTP